MDNDGTLEVVYLLSRMVMMKDAMGSYIDAKFYTTVYKKSLTKSQDYVTLDRERTFIDASIPSLGRKKGGRGFGLLPEKSSWMGYIGTKGDGYFNDQTGSK